MKKFINIIFIFVIGLIFTACSSFNGGEGSDGSAGSDSNTVEMHDSAGFARDDGQVERAVEPEQANNENIGTSQIADMERKVIYSAYLHVEVKDYYESLDTITKKVNEWKGYIVSSTMYGESDTTYGDITIRIPQEHFDSFISFVEENSYKVKDRSISGDDVTEEYVDLESRLKSKRAVENRLMTLMEEAETTEDILAISKELATVQEDIEMILGRMQYLDNHVEYSTVTIHLVENNLKLSNLGDDELNTWEQIKETFMKSVNFLIQLLSSIIVLLIGGLPIIIVTGIIILIIALIYKRMKKRKNNEDDNNQI